VLERARGVLFKVVQLRRNWATLYPTKVGYRDLAKFGKKGGDMKKYTAIEPLEPRIAPATISIVGKTATWTDHDGDLVTMKWTSADAPTFTTMDRGAGLLVSTVLLDAAKHDGASFTVKVKAAGAFGDGRVELGHVNGNGVSLKSWIGPKAAIAEVDLGKHDDVGTGTFISGGIGQTKTSDFIGSMGNGQSTLFGDSKVVKINGDLGYTSLTIGTITQIGATLGTVTITGSLRGDLPSSMSLNGTLFIVGSGKSLFIGGSVLDGEIVHQAGEFKKFTVAGDLIGNTPGNFVSGRVSAKAEQVTILGSILGGQLATSPPSKANSQVITVGGSLVAQDGVQESGVIAVFGSAKSVTVKGSIRGAEFASWSTSDIFPIHSAGAIDVKGSVGSINVGGSIHAGKVANGDPAVNGGIYVREKVSTINIGGGIYGRENAPVYLLARGNVTGATADYNAIGKLSIKKDTINAFIAAGTYMSPPFFDNDPLVLITDKPDAGIGSIFIGGNFVNSNVFAGVDDGGSPGVNNAAINDTLAVGDPALTAKLGPVVIKGHLLSDRASAYFSGFAADVIASITVNGRKVFTAGDGLRNFDTFITAREL
jgi:hypothetical protein